jgi:hypothetical protein
MGKHFIGGFLYWFERQRNGVAISEPVSFGRHGEHSYSFFNFRTYQELVNIWRNIWSALPLAPATENMPTDIHTMLESLLSTSFSVFIEALAPH